MTSSAVTNHVLLSTPSKKTLTWPFGNMFEYLGNCFGKYRFRGHKLKWTNVMLVSPKNGICNSKRTGCNELLSRSLFSLCLSFYGKFCCPLVFSSHVLNDEIVAGKLVSWRLLTNLICKKFVVNGSLRSRRRKG